MLAGSFALFAMACRMTRRNSWRPQVLCAFAIGITIVDLGAFFVPVNQPVRKSELYTETPALRFLRT